MNIDEDDGNLEHQINNASFMFQTEDIDISFFMPLLKYDNKNQNPILTIVHTNGIHYLQIWYCQCSATALFYQQLLWSDLYPVTHIKPKTVFILQILEDCCLENLKCKTAVLNYYSKLCHATSKEISQLVPVSQQFSYWFKPNYFLRTDIKSHFEHFVNGVIWISDDSTVQSTMTTKL